MSTTSSHHVLRIERTFNAKPARVFAAWTDPEMMRIWSAPAGLRIADGTSDIRVGGAWQAAMVNDATNEIHRAGGRYLEVDPPSRLSFTHAWMQAEESVDDIASRATTVLMELFEESGKTRMVFTQTGFESAGSRDGHNEGWSSAFDQLQGLIDG